MSRMKNSGVDQYLHENMTWQRALDFYLQENAYLKTRLSQVLDNITDSDFINKAEHYQNSFIHNDECIKDLQADVLLSQRIMNESLAGKNVDENKMIQKHRKLHNEIGYFEKNFTMLKNEFNQYVGSMV
ncbi:hypothetical protein BH11BAC4_BH11BAC4_21240 [soil metagenome]